VKADKTHRPQGFKPCHLANRQVYFIGICQTPPVFKALPHASPSVVFPVMLFVRPTAAHCHLLLTLLFFNGKSKRQKAATPKNKKTRQEKQP
jgi:hypothetical protein